MAQRNFYRAADHYFSLTQPGEHRCLTCSSSELPRGIQRTIPNPPSHAARAIHLQDEVEKPLHLGERSPMIPTRFR